MVRKIEPSGFYTLGTRRRSLHRHLAGSIMLRCGAIIGCNIGIKSYHFAGDERTQSPCGNKLWMILGLKTRRRYTNGHSGGTPPLYNPTRNSAAIWCALKHWCASDHLGCTALLGVADAINAYRGDIAAFIWVKAVWERFISGMAVPVLRRVKPDTAIGIDILHHVTPDLRLFEVRIETGVGITCLNLHSGRVWPD